jgi:hypothetical protein
MSKMNLHDPFWYLKHKLWPKKDRESKCQFDFQQLKVRNHLDLLAYRWCATYYWKVIDKGYNYASNFTFIKGLHKEIWSSKVEGVSVSGILKLPT